MVKVYLSQRNIPFTEYNVSTNRLPTAGEERGERRQLGAEQAELFHAITSAAAVDAPVIDLVQRLLGATGGDAVRKTPRAASASVTLTGPAFFFAWA